jgi:hypothetical protein
MNTYGCPACGKTFQAESETLCPFCQNAVGEFEEEWKTYTLVNIESQHGNLVSGSWIQDKVGTLAMACEWARRTEEANSNKIKVAVVDKCGGMGQPFPSLPPDMKRLDFECLCGNPEMGFDCICEWLESHPGTTEYSCEFCGCYTANEPRCNKCEVN